MFERGKIVTEKFRTEIFEEWQDLVDAWDKAERELKELESARSDSGAAQGSQREVALREELARLKGEIDGLVLRMAERRDTSTEEMVVALIDNKPDTKSLAAMVRERLSLHGRRR